VPLQHFCVKRHSNQYICNNNNNLNDIIWRAVKRAQIPAVKQPVSLMWDDNKHPDGTTLLPWARGKPMAWDVTIPDTYARSPTLAAQLLSQVEQPIRQHRTRLTSMPYWPAPTFSIHLRWRQLAHGTTWPHGNNIPFPTFIHCSSKGKCGLLPQHYGHRMRCRCFVLVGPKENNNNNNSSR